MKAIRIGVVAVAAAGLLLTGCTSADGPAASPTPAEITPDQLVQALPAGTKPVDAVTWGIAEGEPNTLSPVVSNTIVLPNLCDSLLTLHPDFTVGPGLATKAEWTDPVTFVIDLRDDVQFWDGAPLTPADVIYSLGLYNNPASNWYGNFVAITGMAQTGDHQVTIHFSRPQSQFRDAISGGSGVIVEKAFGERVGQGLGAPGTNNLMCTGPYKLDSWTAGQSIVTSANEDYWQGAPLVKQITYKFIPDGTTLTNALLTGEIDGAFNVPFAGRSQFEASTSGKLYLGQSDATYSFGPTNPDSAAANPKIREALSMAIDRKQYIDVVLHGLGFPAKTFVPPFAWNGSPAKSVYDAGYAALPEPAYDLDKAKQLVAESGVDTSKPLVIVIPAGSTELSQTAALVQSAGQAIGLAIKIDERQPADYGAMFIPGSGATAGSDFIAAQAYVSDPSFFGYVGTFILPQDVGGIYNWTNYSDETVTNAMLGAQTATDPASAANAYVAAEAVFAPALLQITLAGSYQTAYLRNGLTGIVDTTAIYSSPWALHLGGE